jgi:hypothetical protein
MKLSFKTWLEHIEELHLDEWTKEQMIKEMPHTRFGGGLPPELDFLNGAFVDMGFENFGNTEETQRVFRAFGSTGVLVPGTRYRLRHASPGATQIEPADGTEQVSLPNDWKSCVMVMDMNDRFTWVGKKVRPDQTGPNAPPTNQNGYRDMGDGWALEDEAPAASVAAR